MDAGKTTRILIQSETGYDRNHHRSFAWNYRPFYDTSNRTYTCKNRLGCLMNLYIHILERRNFDAPIFKYF